MRKLMWFALGFGLSAAGFALHRPGLWCVFGAALAVVLLVLGLLYGKDRKKLRPVLGILLGIALGSVWCLFYDGVLLEPARTADGETMVVQVELCDYPTETQYGGSVQGYVNLDGRRYKILLYLKEYLPDLKPGDTVTLSAELRLTAEGGSQEPTYHRTQGIFLLAYPRGDMAMRTAEKTPIRYYPAVWRRWLGEQIDVCFPADVRAFIRALILSDKTELDYGTRNDLSLAGLAHLIAVSGLHVSILFAAVQLVTAKRRWLTAAVGIPVVLLFAAVVGFTPSVTRAAVMEVLIMLAAALNREYDPPTALGTAGLVILAVNPMTIASISFQLSFGAVAGIFLFSQRLRRWLLDERRLNAAKGRSFRNRALRFLAGSISITLGASALTVPFLAYYFGTVSLVSPLTNVLCLWAVSLVFYMAVPVCLLGGLCLPLAKGIGSLAAWGVRYILWTARTAVKFPLCAVYTQSVYTLLWLIFAYALFFYFLIYRKRLGIFAVTVALALCFSLLASWVEPLTDTFRVTALDVGQGQCLLLQRGTHTFVVDCGGSDSEDAGEAAARQLLSMGISRVDGVILTHLDLDHMNGAVQLLSRIHADYVAYPQGERTERMAQIEEAAGNTEILRIDANICMEFSGGELEIFAPVQETSGNEGCLAVLFTVGECDTLITGDMETAQERQLLQREDLPDIEILVVGHHGSKYSTGTDLLEAVTPEIAVISVGPNSYGHPTAEVLTRLEEFGCQTYRTDQQGTILIRR